jgi:hypothetical protein
MIFERCSKLIYKYWYFLTFQSIFNFFLRYICKHELSIYKLEFSTINSLFAKKLRWTQPESNSETAMNPGGTAQEAMSKINGGCQNLQSRRTREDKQTIDGPTKVTHWPQPFDQIRKPSMSILLDTRSCNYYKTWSTNWITLPNKGNKPTRPPLSLSLSLCQKYEAQKSESNDSLCKLW